MDNTILTVLVFLGGYLLGSIPFGLLIARSAGQGDIRAIGSGNIGATNVLRTGRKDLAAITLLLDALKAGAGVLIVGHFFGYPLGLVAGAAALIGHCFPIWLKFKGGKGVATSIGAILGLSFWVGIFLIATWIIVALIFRYASVAALITAIAAPIYMLIAGRGSFAFPVLLITILVIWKHWENIDRLRKGTEGKIKF